MVLAALGTAPSEAKTFKFVRDAEIESIIRVYATPLFRAAGLREEAITVYLVQDKRLNAFVTPGLKMFIHTGLLMRAEDPAQVIGVIAHETGHLAAGHTATAGRNRRQASRSIIVSYVIGLAAALATGRPELAGAAVSGGQDIALKNLLSYNRGQESAADQAATRLLEDTGQSPRGLLDFMRLLDGQEFLFRTNQDPYLRSHPVTRERISFLEEKLRVSAFADWPSDPALVKLHARMRAKLFGFLDPIDRVLSRYAESDRSQPARYARAIAHFRSANLATALDLADGLIADDPGDPYFHELKGQMLFESGRIDQAVPEYQTAARLAPESAQIRLGLAQAQIELNSRDSDRAALGHLRKTLRHEPDNTFAWRLSAIAYGRLGDTGMTALALAERSLAGGAASEAREHAARARKTLAKGSPGWLRATDIEGLASRLSKKR